MLKRSRSLIVVIIIAILSALAPAQTGYQPKFKGDPANSDVEAAALGYMRTVVIAQRLYKKKHPDYATSLASLVGSGSFTRRMVNTERGDYTAQFRSTGKNFSLAMTPEQYDAAHRAFFVDDTGTIRAEDDKPATASSPPLKASKE
jgi:hypothetical protein